MSKNANREVRIQNLMAQNNISREDAEAAAVWTAPPPGRGKVDARVEQFMAAGLTLDDAVIAASVKIVTPKSEKLQKLIDLFVRGGDDRVSAEAAAREIMAVNEAKGIR